MKLEIYYVNKTYVAEKIFYLRIEKAKKMITYNSQNTLEDQFLRVEWKHINEIYLDGKLIYAYVGHDSETDTPIEFFKEKPNQ